MRKIVHLEPVVVFVESNFSQLAFPHRGADTNGYSGDIFSLQQNKKSAQVNTPAMNANVTVHTCTRRKREGTGKCKQNPFYQEDQSKTPLSKRVALVFDDYTYSCLESNFNLNEPSTLENYTRFFRYKNKFYENTEAQV